MLRVAVLVSGGGTNLEALLNSKEAGEIPSAEFALVISSSETAYALTRAKNHGVKGVFLNPKGISREEYANLLTKTMKEEKIDLIVLAGFMLILPESFTKTWEKQILNVHPSLIPSFCGDGFYGLHVHEAALAYGVKVTGATVHFVNEICDGGKIILQKAVEVKEGDTPEILQKRVMEEAEWKILPQAVEKIANQRI